MGAPNRLPEDSSPEDRGDDSPRKHWETFEGKRIDPRISSDADPHGDVRFDTHVNPSSVWPSNSGATLKILLAVAGILALALVTYLLFRNTNQQSPRNPESPSGQMMQQSPIHLVASAAVFPLARYRSSQLPQQNSKQRSEATPNAAAPTE